MYIHDCILVWDRELSVSTIARRARHPGAVYLGVPEEIDSAMGRGGPPHIRDWLWKMKFLNLLSEL